MTCKQQDFIVWDRNYCSDDVSSRAIETLSAADQARVSLLKQVQVMHRHGARSTAWTDDCFGNYSVEMDCSELHEVIGSSTSKGDDHGTCKILYDVGNNVYEGTCNHGQLTETGAEQEIQNGRNLKDAYVGSNRKINLYNSIPDISSKQTWLYSTDYTRTRQSILHTLKGYFDYNSNLDVVIHSRDKDNDTWILNHALCPFGEFEHSQIDYNWVAAQGHVYEDFVSSWKDTFGVDFSQGTWDHMSSALCAYWPLPPPLRNQSSSFFKASINYGFHRGSAEILSNYSTLYIKDAMQEIKSKWLSNQEVGYPSLIIWSVHDLTVGAWLQAFDIWDYIYPPFASIITIEFYDMAETETFLNGFRLTYQGKPITQRMSGCATDSDICDINVLFDKFPAGTDWTSYCAQEIPTTSENLFNWDFYVGLMVGVACCTGLVITSLIIIKWRRKSPRNRQMDSKPLN